IEAELTKIYADEMRETKQNTKAQLEQISSSWQETKENIAQEIIQIKETMQKQISPSIFQSLWRGTTAIVALISFLAGGAVIYLVTSSDLQIHRTTIKSYQQEITELKKWQIPQNMQQSWQDEKTNKEQRALVINPK
ncbi:MULTISPECIES: hypothetical protein, partial [unclassified Desulfovibrio]|uniref:hypothetical protein n=1 Tax=unclassified Desulfovibrio TaxID=2593640 RepID=UPI00163B0FF3